VGREIGFDAVEDPIEGTFEAVIIGKLSTHCEEASNVWELAGGENRAGKPGLIAGAATAFRGMHGGVASLGRNEAIHKDEQDAKGARCGAHIEAESG
jgi:hypothetical protein